MKTKKKSLVSTVLAIVLTSALSISALTTFAANTNRAENAENANTTTAYGGELEQYSLANYDVVDIGTLLSDNSILHLNAVAIDNANMGINDFGYYEAIGITSENGEIQVFPTIVRTASEIFAEFVDFGITLDFDIDSDSFGNIYYQGQLVNMLFDDSVGNYISSNDRSGTINVRILRAENGVVTGIEVVEI